MRLAQCSCPGVARVVGWGKGSGGGEVEVGEIGEIGTKTKPRLRTRTFTFAFGSRIESTIYWGLVGLNIETEYDRH